jgi:hypothetical protein
MLLAVISPVGEVINEPCDAKMIQVYGLLKRGLYFEEIR